MPTDLQKFTTAPCQQCTVHRSENDSGEQVCTPLLPKAGQAPHIWDLHVRLRAAVLYTINKSMLSPLNCTRSQCRSVPRSTSDAAGRPSPDPVTESRAKIKESVLQVPRGSSTQRIVVGPCKLPGTGTLQVVVVPMKIPKGPGHWPNGPWPIGNVQTITMYVRAINAAAAPLLVKLRFCLGSSMEYFDNRCAQIIVHI